jgi:L-2-hydroxyglutarate oxidase LhgO
VRPKISGPGAAAADFLFSTHGSKHYLGLYGIESPGLTASLAIADHAVALLPRG